MSTRYARPIPSARVGLGVGLVVWAIGCARGGPSKTVEAPVPIDSGGELVAEDLPPVVAYAVECAEELGPPPGWDILAESWPVPITRDGIAVDAEGFADDPTCDRPALLNGECTPYSRIGRKAGTTADGLPDPDVTWMVTFRRDDPAGDPALGVYKDVAMIGHRASTGATCFFQSFPYELVAELESPLDPDGTMWESPEVVDRIHCVRCHAADPWIHTPWIDQLHDLDDPGRPLVPSGADRAAPYRVVGSAFAQWNTDLQHVSPEGNGCVSCHRMGLNEACERIVPYATGRVASLPMSATGAAFPGSHWMPPGGSADVASWEAAWQADVSELLDCCRAPQQSHCGLAPVPAD